MRSIIIAHPVRTVNPQKGANFKGNFTVFRRFSGERGTSGGRLHHWYTECGSIEVQQRQRHTRKEHPALHGLFAAPEGVERARAARKQHDDQPRRLQPQRREAEAGDVEIQLGGGDHGEQEQLVSCYRTSLALAKEHGCETVAFPLISSGVFGYPRDQALRVAVDTISEFLAENDMTVYIVIFDRAAYQIGNKLFADIAAYIDDHYVDAHTDSRRERMRRMGVVESRMLTAYEDAPMAAGGLDEALAHLDAGFSETLLKLIDRSGKKDAEVYKKANVDRKLFSKIRNNPDYKPSKPTAVAFAIALELSLPETRDLIARAGYALSPSSKFDVIIEYFIMQRDYDIFRINEALFAFDQSLLGA